MTVDNLKLDPKSQTPIPFWMVQYMMHEPTAVLFTMKVVFLSQPLDDLNKDMNLVLQCTVTMQLVNRGHYVVWQNWSCQSHYSLMSISGPTGLLLCLQSAASWRLLCLLQTTISIQHLCVPPRPVKAVPSITVAIKHSDSCSLCARTMLGDRLLTLPTTKITV